MSEPIFVMVDPSAARRKRYPRRKWQDLKGTILGLRKSKTLPEIQRIMRAEHDFDATVSEYKHHFAAWKSRKNLTAPERKFIVGQVAKDPTAIPKFLSTTNWEYIDAQKVKNLWKRKGRDNILHDEMEPDGATVSLLPMPPSPLQAQAVPLPPSDGNLEIDVEEIGRIDDPMRPSSHLDIVFNDVHLRPAGSGEHYVSFQLPEALSAATIQAFADRALKCLGITIDFRYTSAAEAHTASESHDPSTEGKAIGSPASQAVCVKRPLSRDKAIDTYNVASSHGCSITDWINDDCFDDQEGQYHSCESETEEEDEYNRNCECETEEDEHGCNCNCETDEGREDPELHNYFANMWDAFIEDYLRGLLPDVIEDLYDTWRIFGDELAGRSKYVATLKAPGLDAYPFFLKEIEPQLHAHLAVKLSYWAYHLYKYHAELIAGDDVAARILVMDFLLNLFVSELKLPRNHPWRLRIKREIVDAMYQGGPPHPLVCSKCMALKLLEDTTHGYEASMGIDDINTRTAYGRGLGFLIPQPGGRQECSKHLDKDQEGFLMDKMRDFSWKVIASIKEGEISKIAKAFQDFLTVTNFSENVRHLLTTPPSMKLAMSVMKKLSSHGYLALESEDCTALEILYRHVTAFPSSIPVKEYLELVDTIGDVVDGLRESLIIDDREYCRLKIVLSIQAFHNGDGIKAKSLFYSTLHLRNDPSCAWSVLNWALRLARSNAAYQPEDPSPFREARSDRAMTYYEIALFGRKEYYGENHEKFLEVVDDVRIFLHWRGLKIYSTPLAHYYIRGYERLFGPQPSHVMRSNMDANAAAWSTYGLLLCQCK